MVKTAITSQQQKVKHLALGDRITNLYSGDRRPFVQLFRRKSGTVNAVFADTATGHDDMIADPGFFLMTGFPMQQTWHDRCGTAINQGFTGKALIELDRTVDGRDPALVSP